MYLLDDITLRRYTLQLLFWKYVLRWFGVECEMIAN